MYRSVSHGGVLAYNNENSKLGTSSQVLFGPCLVPKVISLAGLLFQLLVRPLLATQECKQLTPT